MRTALLRLLLALFMILGVTAQAASLPELSFHDISGAEQSLPAFSGKIVVLNFWATWCTPCRDELPMLNKVAEQYTGKDVAFIAVSIDDQETESKIPHALQKMKVTLPVWKGATPATLKQLQLGGMVPATIIFDRNGEPIARIMGEASKKDITSRVDWLLSGRTGKQPKALLKNY